MQTAPWLRREYAQSAVPDVRLAIGGKTADTPRLTAYRLCRYGRQAASLLRGRANAGGFYSICHKMDSILLWMLPTTKNDIHNDALEAVRWYPSAANMQPCRIVKDGNAYHFYEKHSERYANRAGWDVQAIDMGIALCHFMSICDGKFILNNPGISTDDHTEYKATVIV